MPVTELDQRNRLRRALKSFGLIPLAALLLSATGLALSDGGLEGSGGALLLFSGLRSDALGSARVLRPMQHLAGRLATCAAGIALIVIGALDL